MKGNQGTLIQALLACGSVKRWHVEDILHEQTGADHCWRVAVIVLCLHDGFDGPVSADLLMACLLHDAHEPWTGDNPQPARRSLPQLQHGEDEGQHRFWSWADTPWLLDYHPEANLSDRDKFWLKLGDMVEPFLKAKKEVSMGNRHMEDVVGELYVDIDGHIKAHTHLLVDAEGLWECIRGIQISKRLTRHLQKLEEHH